MAVQAAGAPHFQAAQRREELEKWANDTQDIRSRLADLGKELQGTYEECVGKMVDVFQRCDAINNEAAQFRAPRGCGLASVDGTARLRDVILPMLGSSSGAKPYWPPPVVPFSVEYSQSVRQMIIGARPPTEQEKIEASKRQMDFVEEQEKGRERLNAEAHARAEAHPFRLTPP